MPQRASQAIESWNNEGSGSTEQSRWRIVPAVIWWTIWKERNMRCFESSSSPLHRIKMNCIITFCYWCSSEYVDDPIAIFEIIGFVYQYLKLLHQNSPQEWIFKELQDIANVEFRYAEEQPQDDYAAELAEGLLVYPPEHVIYGDYAYDVWDAEFIKYVLDFFRPENMRVDVVSKSFQKSDGNIHNLICLNISSLQ
ncbi:hypothetical protein MTR67_039295 [Solanum verrucosum]|uniref:Peptidase M16 middle/third domain-containing protein n=1 Tax=Solanum verrucosum TaxID=315347 RepID=A0AAF0UGN3_SOLVR|nr:hypothetical protein MTR67_039295 [Solanum verrucosum]